MNKPFSKRFDKVRLTSDEARRQGRATKLVLEALSNPGAAIAFLNTHNAALGGRPIDLAVGTEAGLLAIETAIATNGPAMRERAGSEKAERA